MDINRFTEKSQEALQDAQRLAARGGQQYVDVEPASKSTVTTARRVPSSPDCVSSRVWTRARKNGSLTVCPGCTTRFTTIRDRTRRRSVPV